MARKSASRGRGRRKGASGRAKRTTATAAPVSIVNLARGLAALARGLPNPADESTDYFHEFKAPLPVGTALTVDAFKTALGIGRRYRIDLSPADPFFAGASDAENWPDYAAAFHQLDKMMHAALSDVSTAFARADNVVRVRMWLFGRTEDGWLVGLRSIVTET